MLPRFRCHITAVNDSTKKKLTCLNLNPYGCMVYDTATINRIQIRLCIFILHGLIRVVLRFINGFLAMLPLTAVGMEVILRHTAAVKTTTLRKKVFTGVIQDVPVFHI